MQCKVEDVYVTSCRHAPNWISPVYCLLFIIAWGVLLCSDVGLFFCWQTKNLWLRRITLTSLQLCWKSGAMTWSEVCFVSVLSASFPGSQPHSQALSLIPRFSASFPGSQPHSQALLRIQTMQRKAGCWSGNEAVLHPKL